MLLDLTKLNFDDELDDPVLAQEAQRAAEALDESVKSGDASDVMIHLAQWERKAIKSLKRGKGAAVLFETDLIPPAEQERISIELRAAKTTEDVRAIFYRPKTGLGERLMALRTTDPTLTAEEIEAEVKAQRGGVDDLIDQEWEGALEWARKAGA